MKVSEERIEEFFRECERDGRPPTTTGLAMALDFSSRAAMAGYRGTAEEKELLERAALRIENFNEEKLFEKDYVRSAIFNLTNAYEKDGSGGGGKLKLPAELVGSACHSVSLEQNPTDLQTYKPYLYRSVRAIIGSFFPAERPSP